MITVVCGPQGGGKSLYLTELAARCTGPLYTNILLSPNHPKYQTANYLSDNDIYNEDTGAGFWGPLARIPCTIIIDEADIWFDAMDFVKLIKHSRQTRAYWKTIRKRKQRVILAVQEVDNLYGRIIRQCQEFVVCYRDVNNLGPFGMAIRTAIPNFLFRWHRAYFPNRFLLEDQLINKRTLSTKEAAKWFATYYSDQLYATDQEPTSATENVRNPQANPSGVAQ